MSTVGADQSLFVVLGNQLFPFSELRGYRECRFFMAEDLGLCTYVRHHKQKIALFLSAMRSYRDELADRGCDVHYEALGRRSSKADSISYESKLERFCKRNKIRSVVMWEIEDRFFEKRLNDCFERLGIDASYLPSPMFLTEREAFSSWLVENRPHMASFYRWQRKRLGILVDPEGEPAGGRWSFDDENRLALPKNVSIPEVSCTKPTPNVEDVISIVNSRFDTHPGNLSRDAWWLPTTRRQALGWLQAFLKDRFASFGPYEDALTTRDPFVFHSVLSPMLNLGLLTPREVLDKALAYADKHEVPINSLEGFVRQIIGWREFVRGVDQRFGDRQSSANFFDHHRQLTAAWYDGTTRLLPLDDVIRKAQQYGWAHHIERLMIAGNLMTLCEIEPQAAYRWFMEMFVDSSDWVMGPNVYGMGIFSDGGIFSTKPYICGSNYIRKMSDYPKPSPAPLFGDGDTTWCDVMDGLYWRFIDRNRSFFRGQARMAQAIGTLYRIKPDRREHIFKAAEAFLSRATG